jgi:tetratricopeptide (TPR) repeat protein
MPRATDYFEKSLRLDSGYTVARTNLMIAQLFNRSHTDAISNADKMLIESPDSIMALNVKAIALYEQNPSQHEVSIGALRGVLAKVPGDPESTYNLARIYTRTGKTEDARKLWHSFMSKNPSDPLASVVHSEQKLASPTRPPVRHLPPPELKLGELEIEEAEKKLKGPITGRFTEQFQPPSDLQEIAVLYAGDKKYVAIDSKVILIEKRITAGERSANALMKKYGAPDRIMLMHNGRVILYPGFGLEERNGLVETLFWYWDGSGI